MVWAMSVRMRHTRSHTNNRRSHHALATTNVVTDAESGTKRLPHRMDEASGMYRGKQILSKRVLQRREERAEEKSKKEMDHSHDHDLGAGITKEPIHSEKEVHGEHEAKKTGVMGRLTKGRARARSGMGGGA